MGGEAQLVELPGYPFEGQRYWLEGTPGAGDVQAVGQGAREHPFLGAKLALPDHRGWLFTGRLSLQTHPWLADHQVSDTVLFPGTAFVELALFAGSEVGCPAIEELSSQAPLVLPAQGAVQIQLSVAEPDESGRCQIDVYSRSEKKQTQPEDELEWTHHATGTLSEHQALTPQRSDPIQSWPPRVQSRLRSTISTIASPSWVSTTPAFQSLQAAWRCGDEIFGEIALDDEQQHRAGHDGAHRHCLMASSVLVSHRGRRT